jgi:hypothetical protein
MVDARYDKVNPDVGLFRAPLAAAISAGVSASGGYGPVAVSLNASGQVVIGTAGQSGFVGVLVKNFPTYPRLGNIPGQPNIAVPIGGSVGNVVDIMTAGEITNGAGWVAGTAYYAAADGTLTTNPSDGPLVGWTVGADRLVVRTDVGGSAGGGFSGQTANATPVANTVTETPLLTIGLDANEVTAGSVYEIKGWGVYSNTGTPTVTFGIKLGGIAGTALVTTAATTTVTGASNDAFQFEGTVNFHSATKAVAKLKVDLATVTTLADATVVLAASNGEVTVDTTTAKTIGVDLTWGTASASNTLQLQGGYAKRVA